MTELADAIKTSLDELRMQMLGVQVLFGFQFQGLFQAGFPSLSPAARVVDAMGMLALVLALTLLIAVPCQHRIVEEGEASERLFKAARRVANVALLPLAAAIGCDILVTTSTYLEPQWALAMAALSSAAATGLWYGLPRWLREPPPGGTHTQERVMKTPLHAKIEQMLTEARVVLPGAQALLGFQMVVMLTPAFRELPASARNTHVSALLFDVLAVILLICPAAVHRITFGGHDVPRMHTIGSALVTAALAPLAVSVTLDVYVALLRLFDSAAIAVACSIAALLCMSGCWYVIPLIIKRRWGPLAEIK